MPRDGLITNRYLWYFDTLVHQYIDMFDAKTGSRLGLWHPVSSKQGPRFSYCDTRTGGVTGCCFSKFLFDIFWLLRYEGFYINSLYSHMYLSSFFTQQLVYYLFTCTSRNLFTWSALLFPFTSFLIYIYLYLVAKYKPLVPTASSGP